MWAEDPGARDDLTAGRRRPAGHESLAGMSQVTLQIADVFKVDSKPVPRPPGFRAVRKRRWRLIEQQADHDSHKCADSSTEHQPGRNARPHVLRLG